MSDFPLSDHSEFLCPLCQNQYDNNLKLPRLLPTCGHTFCSECLQNLIQNSIENMPFICPEDGEEIDLAKKDLNSFPKNAAFIKLMQKKKILSENTLPEIIEKNKSFLSENESLLPNKVDSPKEKFEKISIVNEINEDKSDFLTTNNTKRLCLEHQRPLEVVCIDHQTRICTNCALFGAHKNHNIKPEQDVLFEITNRAENLCNLFQRIGENQKNGDSEEYFNIQKMKIKEKEFEFFETVNKKFEDLFHKIKKQQEKFNLELQDKFQDLADRFRILTIPKKELSDKINQWKNTASNCINSLSLHEIAFELLPNLSSPQNDLLKRGEHILCEQELLKDRNGILLNDTLKSLRLNIKDNYFNFLDSFCSLECNVNSDLLVIWNSFNQNKSFNGQKTFFSNLNNFIKKNDNDYYSNKPKQINQDFDKKEQNFNKEKSIKIEEDNDLLNLDLNNFTLTEMPEFNNFNKIFSDNSIVYSNNSNANNSSNNGQNSSTFGNLTPIRNMNENPPNVNVQKVLTESLMNNRQNVSNEKNPNQNQNQPQIVTHQRGNTPITDRKLFINNENTLKIYKKKNNFRISEKYEPILEGLKKDSLEIVDFTGAEIGDIGLQYISEFISKSKNMKSLKLLKNKITNDGLPILIKALTSNLSLVSLNLAQNMLSDKALEVFAGYFENNRNIKLLCLNQNNLNLRNAKNKIGEFKKLGINISI